MTGYCVAAEPGMSTLKTLFAYSSNVCAMREIGGPACEEQLTNRAWRRVKGEVAHIRGEKPGSARYDPSMTDEERAAYQNLILLCPNHHKLIDSLEPDTYTVEILEEMKYRHEEDRKWASEDRLEELAVLVLADLGIVVAAPPPDDGRLRNLAGVPAESFTDQPVENLTPPGRRRLMFEDGHALVIEQGDEPVENLVPPGQRRLMFEDGHALVVEPVEDLKPPGRRGLTTEDGHPLVTEADVDAADPDDDEIMDRTTD